MTHETGSTLQEEPVDDGMLHEAADKRLVYTTRKAKFGE